MTSRLSSSWLKARLLTWQRKSFERGLMVQAADWLAALAYIEELEARNLVLEAMREAHGRGGQAKASGQTAEQRSYRPRCCDVVRDWSASEGVSLMGVYRRKNSPYWWVYIETAPPGEQFVSTKIPVGQTPATREASRQLALIDYHQRALGAKSVTLGVTAQDAPAVALFDDVAAWYDTHHIARHKGHEREREILPKFRLAFGHLPVTAITKAMVIEWRTARAKTPTVVAHFGGPKGKPRTLPPPKAITVNREVDLLQQVLAAWAEAGHIAVSPLLGLPNLDIIKPTRRIMSETEEAALAKEMAPEDWALFLLSLDALVRFSDALDVRRSDDLGHEINIVDPKNGEPLSVPVSSRLRRALDAVPRDPEGSAYYFYGRRGAATERDRRGGFAHALRRACERADVPYGRVKGGVTFHWATRRTGATRAIRRGGEKAIGVVQRIGGWKDARTLIGIYQETITADMRAAVESIGGDAAPAMPAKKTAKFLLHRGRKS